MQYDKPYKFTNSLILELKRYLKNGNVLYVRPVGGKKFVFTNENKEGYYKIEYSDRDYIKYRLKSLNNLFKKHISVTNT